MIATYRLSQRSCSFEFFSWLVMVKAMGATEVVLDIRNPKDVGRPKSPQTLDEVMQKFHTIVEPGAALAGLKSRRGRENSPLEDAEHAKFLPWFLERRKFSRLQSVKPSVKCNYTVTIRDYKFAPARNSNEDAWRRFAEEIGAVVIEDYSIKPIHLHDRFALYAGAKMNFGVCNGPVYTISLTEYPVTIYVNGKSAWNSLTKWGFEERAKFPWMLDNQTHVWEEDTLDNLRRNFERLKC